MSSAVPRPPKQSTYDEPLVCPPISRKTSTGLAVIILNSIIYQGRQLVLIRVINRYTVALCNPSAEINLLAT
jgi:hypothetical protein